MLKMRGRGHHRRTLVRLAEIPAHVVVVLFLLLDDLVVPLFRPFARWVAGQSLVLRLQRWIARLPRYVILLILILPLAIAEPAKIFALYLIGCDHVMIGLGVLFLAYVISIIVVERIFDAGRSKLMRIAWFAQLWSWLSGIRDKLTEWVHSTRVWRRLMAFRAQVRRIRAERFRRLPAAR